VGEVLVDCPFFVLEHLRLDGPPRRAADPGEMAILQCLSGAVQCAGERLSPGELGLLPAASSSASLAGTGELLRVSLPR